MKALTTLLLTTTFAASIYSTAISANELSEQMRSVASVQLIELRHSMLLDVKLALTKTANELNSRLAKTPDSAVRQMLAYKADQPLQRAAKYTVLVSSSWLLLIFLSPALSILSAMLLWQWLAPLTE